MLRVCYYLPGPPLNFSAHISLKLLRVVLCMPYSGYRCSVYIHFQFFSYSLVSFLLLYFSSTFCLWIPPSVRVSSIFIDPNFFPPTLLSHFFFFFFFLYFPRLSVCIWVCKTMSVCLSEQASSVSVVLCLNRKRRRKQPSKSLSGTYLAHTHAR